jgi:DNA repair protein RecO (recombination protein O)
VSLYKATGINLRNYNLSDSDKVVIVYTREFGKIKCVAKGAKKITSRYGGRIEPFVCNQMLLSQGKTFDLISQLETLESFYALRQSEQKLLLGTYFLHVINTVTADHIAHPEIYDLLYLYLSKLMISENYHELRVDFQQQLLKQEGYLPENFSQLHFKKDQMFDRFLQDHGIKMGSGKGSMISKS